MEWNEIIGNTQFYLLKFFLNANISWLGNKWISEYIELFFVLFLANRPQENFQAKIACNTEYLKTANN